MAKILVCRIWLVELGLVNCCHTDDTAEAHYDLFVRFVTQSEVLSMDFECPTNN
jgi:hypothetical protein